MRVARPANSVHRVAATIGMTGHGDSDLPAVTMGETVRDATVRLAIATTATTDRDGTAHPAAMSREIGHGARVRLAAKDRVTGRSALALRVAVTSEMTNPVGSDRPAVEKEIGGMTGPGTTALRVAVHAVTIRATNHGALARRADAMTTDRPRESSPARRADATSVRLATKDHASSAAPARVPGLAEATKAEERAAAAPPHRPVASPSSRVPVRLRRSTPARPA